MHANLHITTIRRSAGRDAVGASAYRSGSVVASAAYRAGEKLTDNQQRKTHDYTQKHNVLHAEIITPQNAPEWMKDRQKLWNAVEAGEKRKDAQLAKEVVLVLPRNLDTEQQIKAVRSFINDNITSRNLVADFAIHSPDASDGGKNPHAHVMFTLRPVEGDGFGKKLTGYKNGGLDSREVLQELRFGYQDALNLASKEADSEIIFDLRSLKEKGVLDRLPQPKIGPKVNYMEKRGYKTEWGKQCRRHGHQTHNQGYQTYYTQKQKSLVAEAHEDITNTYYQVMWGKEHSQGKDNSI